MSSTYDVSCAAFDWRGAGAEHVGVSRKSNVAVDLDSEGYLNHVVELQEGRVFRERRGVAGNFVHGDTRRESNTFLALTLLVDCIKLLFHEFVGKGAKIRGAGAGQAERDNLRHGVIGDGSSLLVL